MMKDCQGYVLSVGDRVVIVVPIAPVRHCLHMLGVVVKDRGSRIGIRLPDSDYVKGIRNVLPDTIQKESIWAARRKARARRHPEKVDPQRVDLGGPKEGESLMPNAREIHEAMGILLAKTEDKAPYMCAEHDEVFLPGPPPEAFTAEEQKKLEELRVTWDEGNESWHCFV
jgi:hypothetical protein